MKHIRLYFFVLFTACSMFMVCPFAHAESMPANIQQYLYTDFDSYFTSWQSYSSDINTIISNCPYFVRYFVTISGTQYAVYDFFTYENLGINSIYPNKFYSAGYSSNSAGCIYTLDSSYILPSTGTIGYRIFTRVSDGRLYCILWFSASQSSNISSNYYPAARFYPGTSGDVLVSVSRPNGSSFSVDYSNYISSGNCYINYSNNSFYLASNTAIVYTDDDRLKLYKLWSSQNGDSLVVDLSAFRYYTPAAAYEFSNIVLTLSCNGVDTDYNLPLSSSTINNGWNNNSNLYTISTPVSDFILSDTYDTYITKVSFSLDVSSPGGSGSTPFYISTNFPLDVHHSSITPGAVPTPVYSDPTIKFDSEISNLIGELNNQSSSTINGQFDYSSTGVVPSWCDKYQDTLYRFTNNSSSSVAGEFVDKVPFENGNVTNYHVINVYDYLSSIINSFDNSYDVFVFPVDVWFVSDVVTTPNYTDNGISYYIIFYTTRYFQRQSALTDTDILYVLQKDANNFVDFVEYMQVRLDDFESKSLEILNPIYDETTYIDDKLASILYAVNSIENYNDSSIVSLLTDIKNLLLSPENEIDTPQECIQLYEAHPNYFDELWGTPTPAFRSASVTPSSNNPYISSDFVRADLVPAWWEGKTLTMIYILKNDGETSRFYNDILNGLFDSFENLIESDNSFNTFIDSLFKTGYDYTDSFYGHMFDLDYNPEAWNGGFAENE